MSINQRTTFVTLVTTVVAVVAMSRCSGSSSGPQPSSNAPAVSSVTLNATSVTAGGIVQGTVTLTAAAPAGGAGIALSSSNPAVATVPAAATAQAGSLSVTFNLAAAAAGTTTITASLNGSSGQSPVLNVTAGPALSAISVSSTSVVGGNPVNGTVTLTAAALGGGAVVSLSGSDPVSVPASVTVPAGSTTATFSISTRAVAGTIASTISGSYGGASASVVLSVTPPTVASARFGVSGPTESDTCVLANSGNTLNCTFNGSTSTAPGTITAWDWSYGVTTILTQTTSGPVLSMPGISCGQLPPPPPPAGVSWLTIHVTLTIHDSLGNVDSATNNSVRILPEHLCGF